MFKSFLEESSPKNKILKDIYLLIYQNGPIPKTELLEKTNLKQATLALKIGELLKKKFIYESGIGESTGGRPPVLYEINPECGYMIGIQITRLELKIILVDLYLHVIDQKNFLITSLHTPPIVISKIKETVMAFLKMYKISFERLLGIGFGTVGALDRKNGTIVSMGAFPALGWENIRMIEIMKEDFPVRIFLENVSNTAVLAEYHNMTPKIEDILYCVISKGLGCGIISNGELIQGKTGFKSRYEHMVIDVGGRRCSCGKKGCLISYTSAYSIMEELKKRDPVMNGWKGEVENIPINDLIEFLKQDNPISKKVVMESAYYLGVGLSNVINMYQSELVILDGPLISEYPNYYEKVIESIREHLDEKESVRFSMAKLGGTSASVGAALLVFHSYF